MSTPADIFLSFGGKTCFIMGSAFTALGAIYGVHRMTGTAIRVIKSLPFLLGLQLEEENKEMEKETSSKMESVKGLTRTEIVKEIFVYTKISSTIVIGILIKMFGNWIASENVINTFKGMLYGK